MKHYPPPCFTPLNDLQIARAAAAQQAIEGGYPQLKHGYIDGDWDGDSEVQTALIAVRMARQIESIEIQAKEPE